MEIQKPVHSWLGGLQGELWEKIEMPLEVDKSEKLLLTSCVALSKPGQLPEPVSSGKMEMGTQNLCHSMAVRNDQMEGHDIPGMS